MIEITRETPTATTVENLADPSVWGVAEKAWNGRFSVLVMYRGQNEIGRSNVTGRDSIKRVAALLVATDARIGKVQVAMA